MATNVDWAAIEKEKEAERLRIAGEAAKPEPKGRQAPPRSLFPSNKEIGGEVAAIGDWAKDTTIGVGDFLYGAAEPIGKSIARRSAHSGTIDEISEKVKHHEVTQQFLRYLELQAEKGEIPDHVYWNLKTRPSNVLGIPLGDRGVVQQQAEWMRSANPDQPQLYKDLQVAGNVGTQVHKHPVTGAVERYGNSRFEDSPFYKAAPEFWDMYKERAATDRAVEGQYGNLMGLDRRADKLRQDAEYPVDSAFIRDFEGYVRHWEELVDKDQALAFDWWNDLQALGQGTYHFITSLAGFPEIQKGQTHSQAMRTLGNSMTGGLMGAISAGFSEDPQYGLKVMRKPMIMMAVTVPTLLGVARAIKSGKASPALKDAVNEQKVKDPAFARAMRSAMKLVPEVIREPVGRRGKAFMEWETGGKVKVKDPVGPGGIEPIAGEFIPTEGAAPFVREAGYKPGQYRPKVVGDWIKSGARDLGYSAWTGLPFIGPAGVMMSIGVPGVFRGIYSTMMATKIGKATHAILNKNLTVGGKRSTRSEVEARDNAREGRAMAQLGRGKRFVPAVIAEIRRSQKLRVGRQWKVGEGSLATTEIPVRTYKVKGEARRSADTIKTDKGELLSELPIDDPLLRGDKIVETPPEKVEIQRHKPGTSRVHGRGESPQTVEARAAYTKALGLVRALESQVEKRTPQPRRVYPAGTTPPGARRQAALDKFGVHTRKRREPARTKDQRVEDAIELVDARDKLAEARRELSESIKTDEYRVKEAEMESPIPRYERGAPESYSDSLLLRTKDTKGKIAESEIGVVSPRRAVEIQRELIRDEVVSITEEMIKQYEAAKQAEGLMWGEYKDHIFAMRMASELVLEQHGHVSQKILREKYKEAKADLDQRAIIWDDQNSPIDKMDLFDDDASTARRATRGRDQIQAAVAFFKEAIEAQLLEGPQRIDPKTGEPLARGGWIEDGKLVDITPEMVESYQRIREAFAQPGKTKDGKPTVSYEVANRTLNKKFDVDPTRKDIREDSGMLANFAPDGSLIVGSPMWELVSGRSFPVTTAARKAGYGTAAHQAPISEAKRGTMERQAEIKKYKGDAAPRHLGGERRRVVDEPTTVSMLNEEKGIWEDVVLHDEPLEMPIDNLISVKVKKTDRWTSKKKNKKGETEYFLETDPRRYEEAKIRKGLARNEDGSINLDRAIDSLTRQTKARGVDPYPEGYQFVLPDTEYPGLTYHRKGKSAADPGPYQIQSQMPLKAEKIKVVEHLIRELTKENVRMREGLGSKLTRDLAGMDLAKLRERALKEEIDIAGLRSMNDIADRIEAVTIERAQEAQQQKGWTPLREQKIRDDQRARSLERIEKMEPKEKAEALRQLGAKGVISKGATKFKPTQAPAIKKAEAAVAKAQKALGKAEAALVAKKAKPPKKREAAKKAVEGLENKIKGAKENLRVAQEELTFRRGSQRQRGRVDQEGRPVAAGPQPKGIVTKTGPDLTQQLLTARGIAGREKTPRKKGRIYQWKGSTNEAAALATKRKLIARIKSRKKKLTWAKVKAEKGEIVSVEPFAAEAALPLLEEYINLKGKVEGVGKLNALLKKEGLDGVQKFIDPPKVEPPKPYKPSAELKRGQTRIKDIMQKATGDLRRLLKGEVLAENLTSKTKKASLRKGLKLTKEDLAHLDFYELSDAVIKATEKGEELAGVARRAMIKMGDEYQSFGGAQITVGMKGDKPVMKDAPHPFYQSPKEPVPYTPKPKKPLTARQVKHRKDQDLRAKATFDSLVSKNEKATTLKHGVRVPKPGELPQLAPLVEFLRTLDRKDISPDLKRHMWITGGKIVAKNTTKLQIGFAKKFESPVAPHKNPVLESLAALARGEVIPETMSKAGGVGRLAQTLFGDPSKPKKFPGEFVQLQEAVNSGRITPNEQLAVLTDIHRKVMESSKDTKYASSGLKKERKRLFEAQTIGVDLAHKSASEAAKKTLARAAEANRRLDIDNLEFQHQNLSLPAQVYNQILRADLAKMMERIDGEINRIHNDNAGQVGTHGYYAVQAAKNIFDPNTTNIPKEGTSVPFRAEAYRMKEMREDGAPFYFREEQRRLRENKKLTNYEKFALENALIDRNVEANSVQGMANRTEANSAAAKAETPLVKDIAFYPKEFRAGRTERPQMANYVVRLKNPWSNIFDKEVRGVLKEMQLEGRSKAERDAWLASLIEIMNEGPALLMSDTLKMRVADLMVDKILEDYATKATLPGEKRVKVSTEHIEKINKAVDAYLAEFDLPYRGMPKAAPWSTQFAGAGHVLGSLPDIFTWESGDHFSYSASVPHLLGDVMNGLSKKEKLWIAEEATARFMAKSVALSKNAHEGALYNANMRRLGISYGHTVGEIAARIIYRTILSKDAEPQYLPVIGRKKGKKANEWEYGMTEPVSITPTDIQHAMLKDLHKGWPERKDGSTGLIPELQKLHKEDLAAHIAANHRVSLKKLNTDKGLKEYADQFGYKYELSNKDLSRLFGKDRGDAGVVGSKSMVQEFADYIGTWKNKEEFREAAGGRMKKAFAALQADIKFGEPAFTRMHSDLVPAGEGGYRIYHEAVDVHVGDRWQGEQQLMSRAVSKAAMQPDFANSIAWDALISQQMAEVSGRIMSIAKGGLTVRSLLTQLGNIAGNTMAISMTTGESLFAVLWRLKQTEQLFSAYRKDPASILALSKNPKKNRDVQILAEAVYAIDKYTGIDLMDFKSTELVAPRLSKERIKFEKAQASHRNKWYRAKKWAEGSRGAKVGRAWSEMWSDLYQKGDNVPRRAEVLREYAEGRQYLDDMPEGTGISLQVSQRGYTTIYKDKKGLFIRRAGQKGGPGGQRIYADMTKNPMIEKVLAAYAARRVMGRIFNYRNVPRIIELARAGGLGLLGLLASPFISFPYLAADFFGKKGILSSTVFDSLTDQSVITNSKKIIAQRAINQTLRGVRKGLILTQMQAIAYPNSTDINENAKFKRTANDMGAALPRSSGRYNVVDLLTWTNANSFKTSVAISNWVLATHGNIAYWLMLRGKHGFDFTADEEMEVYENLNPSMKEALARINSKQGATKEDFAGIFTLGGGLAMSLWDEAKKPQNAKMSGASMAEFLGWKLSQMFIGTNETRLMQAALVHSKHELGYGIEPTAKGGASPYDYPISDTIKAGTATRDPLSKGWKDLSLDQQTTFLRTYLPGVISRFMFKPRVIMDQSQMDSKNINFYTRNFQEGMRAEMLGDIDSKIGVAAEASPKQERDKYHRVGSDDELRKLKHVQLELGKDIDSIVNSVVDHYGNIQRFEDVKFKSGTKRGPAYQEAHKAVRRSRREVAAARKRAGALHIRRRQIEEAWDKDNKKKKEKQ